MAYARRSTAISAPTTRSALSCVRSEGQMASTPIVCASLALFAQVPRTVPKGMHASAHAFRKALHACAAEITRELPCERPQLRDAAPRVVKPEMSSQARRQTVRSSQLASSDQACRGGHPGTGGTITNRHCY
jgi:hypothetical protein